MILFTHRWGREGAHLVLLHGMGGTGILWRPHAAALEETRLLTAPDQRGHGKSRGASGGFAPSDYARDLKETLDSLGGPWPVYLVGHSMGVRTAIAYAKLDPSRVAGLVLVDLGFQPGSGGGLGRKLSPFLRELPGSFPTREEARAYMAANCPDAAIAQYLLAVGSLNPPEVRFPFDRESLLTTIEAAHAEPLTDWVREFATSGKPVVALRGANSNVWSEAQFEEDVARFRDLPNVRLETWEDAGHGLPFEQRERLVTLLKELTTEAL